MLFLIFYALLKIVFCIRIIIRRARTVTLSRLIIAALTVVSATLLITAPGLIATLTLIVAMRLIVSRMLRCTLFAVIIIVAGTVTVVVTRLITLLSRLIALLLIVIVTRTIAGVALLSVAVALLIALSWLIAALLIVVVTRTVAALLSSIMLQTGSEPFGTETSGIVVIASVCVVRTPLIYARTHLTTYRSVALIVRFSVALAAVLVLLCRLFVLHVVEFFCHFFSLL